MDYYSFFKKLQEVDSRVKFVRGDKHLKCENLEIPKFYQMVNPINVEFEFNDGVIKLEPYERLFILNEEYHYVATGCVFATCNGEPIYIRNGEVYTCVYGAKHIVEEKIAASVDELFEQVSSTL